LGKLWQSGALTEVLASRKQSWEAAQQQELPEFFILPRGRYFQNFANVINSAGDREVFRGLGVSGGRAEGKVRIIHDPSQDKGLEPGEILVAKTTDPGWTPLFMVAGGLILEKGGLLSHGAIVAREFGIPAVVGVEEATRLFADEQRVAVDGTLGEVVILPNRVDA
jgi:phosphoenolpyruvate synthase/pyruvate phosphate dikinase